MEDVHAVTRPAWTVNFAKNWLISVATVVGAIEGTSKFTELFKYLLKDHSKPESLNTDSAALASLVLTIVIPFMVAALIKWRTPKPDQYPRTFIYCFQKGRHTYAVGKFELKCDTGNGEMQADGYVYDACVSDAGSVLEKTAIPDGAQMREWHSLHIGASDYRHLKTCYIAFKFDPPEHTAYLYGLIRFEKMNKDGFINNNTSYRGNINGIAPPADSADTNSAASFETLPIYPRVYAELIEGEIEVNDICRKLNEYAPKLKAATDQLP